MSFMHRLIAISCLVAIGGCAQCPPYRAAWYLHDPVQPLLTAQAPSTVAGAASSVTAKPPPAAGIYLALLNEGDQAAHLTQVIVNPGRDGSGAKVLALPDSSMEQKWHPGELRVFHIEALLGDCSIPVTVQLRCGKDCDAPAQKVSGSLPNYLHDVWLLKCSRPAGGANR